jgi:RHS repeat-associated protein
LLAVNVPATSKTYLPCYDGNGNVMAYVDSADGSLAAEYEYSPSPAIISKNGAQADDLAAVASFSAKPYDKDLDAFLYQLRILKYGKWLSRDPIEEKGGANLYGFVGNDPVNRWDMLGMASATNPDGTTDIIKLLEITRNNRIQARFKQLNCVLNELLSLVSKMHNASEKTLDKHSFKGWSDYVLPATSYYSNNYSSSDNWNVGGIGIGGDGFNPILFAPSIASNTFFGDEITAIATLIHEPQHDLSQRGLGHGDKNGKDWGAQIQTLLSEAKIVAQQTRIKGCCNKDPNKSTKIKNLYDKIKCDCEIFYQQ